MNSPYTILSSIIFFFSIFRVNKNLAVIFYSFLIILASILICNLNLSDLEGYFSYFQLIKLGQDLSSYRFEPLYYFTNKLFSFFSDFSFLRAFLIGFALTIKLVFFRSFGKNIPLALLSYFALQFYVDSYLLRLTFAVTFILIAIIFRYRNKNLLAFIFLIFAINSHYSAIALAPFLLIQNIYIPIYFIVFPLIIILTFQVSDLTPFILEIIINYVIPLVNLIGFSTTDAISIYYEDYYFGESLGLLRGSLIIYALIFIVFKFINKNYLEEEKKSLTVLENGMLFSLLMLIVLNNQPTLGDRLARYTLTFFPIALGLIISRIPNNLSRFFIPFVSIIILIGSFILDEGPYEPISNLIF